MNKEIERNNSMKKRILFIAFGIWYIFFDDMFEFGLNVISTRKMIECKNERFYFDESYKNELIIINTNIDDIKNQYN